MAEALARNSAQYNARFSAARRGGALVDADGFLIHLGNTVGPIIDAVHAHIPERVIPVLDALFDVSIEVFAASMLGPRNKSPAVGEVWRKLLPAIPKLVMRDPKTVAAALSNAADNVGRTNGARAGEWLTLLQRAAPTCESVPELLDAGKVAAWRSGMPHYRSGAITVANSLRPAIAAEIFGAEAERIPAMLERMRADPWLVPEAAVASAEPLALRLVGVGGAFRGFGGEFLRPPTVTASGGMIFVTDDEGVWRLICDCFGQLLLRHAGLLPTDTKPPDVHVTSDGITQWGPDRATLPQLANASSFACDEPAPRRLSIHEKLTRRLGPLQQGVVIRPDGCRRRSSQKTVARALGSTKTKNTELPTLRLAEISGFPQYARSASCRIRTLRLHGFPRFCV